MALLSKMCHAYKIALPSFSYILPNISAEFGGFIRCDSRQNEEKQHIYVCLTNLRNKSFTYWN